LFSPQIFLESQNKETELKKERENGSKRKRKKKERRKRASKVSQNKGMDILREEKNISTSNLFA
jgi:hypothetical protein